MLPYNQQALYQRSNKIKSVCHSKLSQGLVTELILYLDGKQAFQSQEVAQSAGKMEMMVIQYFIVHYFII